MGIHKSPIQNTPELNIIAAWKKKAQDTIMLWRELEKRNKNNLETSMTWLRQWKSMKIKFKWTILERLM